MDDCGLAAPWRNVAWYFYDRGGPLGIANAALVTVLMLLLTRALVGAGIRLKV